MQEKKHLHPLYGFSGIDTMQYTYSLKYKFDFIKYNLYLYKFKLYFIKPNLYFNSTHG